MDEYLNRIRIDHCVKSLEKNLRKWKGTSTAEDLAEDKKLSSPEALSPAGHEPAIDEGGEEVDSEDDSALVESVTEETPLDV